MAGRPARGRPAADRDDAQRRLSDGRALRVIAVYVPSRDASPEKVERKRRFLAEFGNELGGCADLPAVLLGDLNVLEPEHRPRYPF